MNPLTGPGMESTPTPTTSPGASSPDVASSDVASPVDTSSVDTSSVDTTLPDVAPPGALSVAATPAAATPAASGHATVAARAAARHTSMLVRGTAGLIVRYKLETVAVLLLGVGGAVYPPVWLLGVLVALPSRVWDLRDKWTGLVAPVLLVIVSTVLVVVFGGKHPTIGSYAIEAWLGAERAARIAAALGAVYLFWRLRRGKRPAKEPPFGQPHRLG